MSRSTIILSSVVLALAAAAAIGADKPKYRPIVAGELTVNPYDIVAVYRPAELQLVVVLVGRPGQDVQAIVFRDPREGNAVFNEIWNNNDIAKDPGDDDAKPLTRMVPKDGPRKSGVLIANVDRLLAVVRDADRRLLRVYMDIPNAVPLAEGDNAPARTYLEISNSNSEADDLLAAYKVCLYGR